VVERLFARKIVQVISDAVPSRNEPGDLLSVTLFPDLPTAGIQVRPARVGANENEYSGVGTSQAQPG